MADVTGVRAVELSTARPVVLSNDRDLVTKDQVVGLQSLRPLHLVLVRVGDLLVFPDPVHQSCVRLAGQPVAFWPEWETVVVAEMLRRGYKIARLRRE